MDWELRTWRGRAFLVLAALGLYLGGIPACHWLDIRPPVMRGGR